MKLVTLFSIRWYLHNIFDKQLLNFHKGMCKIDLVKYFTKYIFLKII